MCLLSFPRPLSNFFLIYLLVSFLYWLSFICCLWTLSTNYLLINLKFLFYLMNRYIPYVFVFAFLSTGKLNQSGFLGFMGFFWLKQKWLSFFQKNSILGWTRPLQVFAYIFAACCIVWGMLDKGEEHCCDAILGLFLKKH